MDTKYKRIIVALSQKDIDNLKPKDKRYMISLGEPKELYIRVHPSGKKVFYLRARKFNEFITLGEYQKNALDLKTARELAKEKLQNMINGTFKHKSIKPFSLLNANELYLKKYKSILAPSTLKKRTTHI